MVGAAYRAALPAAQRDALRSPVGDMNASGSFVRAEEKRRFPRWIRAKVSRGTRAEGAPTSRDASTEEPPPPPRGEWSRAGRAARAKRVSQTASARLTTPVARAVVANAKAAGPEGTRALVCESATGAAVRDAIKKCLVIRQTSKPLANSQKGFLEAHFNGTVLITSHEVPLIFISTRCDFSCGFASSLSPRADVRTVHRGLPTVVARRGPWKRVSSHSRGSHARSTASGVGALACTGRAPRARHTRFQRPRSGARRA